LTRKLASKIYQASHLTGEFTLRSGMVSTEYFDKYRFEAEPVLLKEIATEMTSLLPGSVDYLAGLEMGGIPIATMLSQVTKIPALFVRKQAKTYGTCKLAEGGDFEGLRLIIVEDVVTSGGQINISANELRALGAIVTHAVCVIDREAGGVRKLADNGIELRALYTMSELTSEVTS
jgi:orotate phosphoribosyltransferase